MSGLNDSIASLVDEAKRRKYRLEIRSDGRLLVEGRKGEFQDKLLDHGDEIKRYLTGADEQSEETPEPPVEPFIPFPLEALPKWMRGFVETLSRSIGCDESYVILPLLAALAACVGNARSLLLKRGWAAPSILWTVAIGESGCQKSPPFRLVVQPLRDLQKHLIDSHGELADQYEKRKARHEADLAIWKRKPEGDPPERPEAPSTPRLVVSDSTIEALASILRANPRGVLLARDELSGWISSFGRYSTGKSSCDISAWLSLFNGETLIVDRKTGERLTIVPHASVSLSGGIQPEIFSKAIRGELRESGLLARMLLAFPPPRSKQWTDNDVPPELISGIERIFDNLRSLQSDEFDDGALKPALVRLSPEAKSIFVDFYNQHAQETVDLSGDLASIWAKTEEASARLALVHHLTRWASDENVEVSIVDAESMQSGVRMGRWFANEAKRILTMLNESADEGSQRRMVDWITRRGGEVTVREAQQGHRDLRTSDDAEATLNELRDAGYGTWRSDPPGPKGGRPTRVFKLTVTSTSTQPEIPRETRGFVDDTQCSDSEVHLDPTGPKTSIPSTKPLETRRKIGCVDVDSVDDPKTRPVSNGGDETGAPKAACDHNDPDSWVHRDGAAFCPGCDKWMGRVK